MCAGRCDGETTRDEPVPCQPGTWHSPFGRRRSGPPALPLIPGQRGDGPLQRIHRHGLGEMVIHTRRSRSLLPFGEHYLDPQEVERQRLAVRSQCDGDLEATFEIETSAIRGTPNRVTSTGSDPGAACVKSVERMLMDKEYLPGFVDERPVAMLRTVRFSRDIEWATGTLGKEPSYIESTLRGLERGRRPRRQ